MRSFVARVFAGAAAFLALTSAASAIETGTPAWTITPLAVYEGPGNAYEVIGDVEGKIELRVDRCTYRWCRIHEGSVRGWVSRDLLSFGQHPRGIFSGPHLGYKSGGPGRICLYEGHNYSGDYICAPSGAVVHDLLLFDRDNRYSSIRIEGNLSITLCRDRDFASYCQRVNESEPELHGFLDNNVSSYRVH